MNILILIVGNVTKYNPKASSTFEFSYRDFRVDYLDGTYMKGIPIIRYYYNRYDSFQIIDNQ